MSCDASSSAYSSTTGQNRQQHDQQLQQEAQQHTHSNALYPPIPPTSLPLMETTNSIDANKPNTTNPGAIDSFNSDLLLENVMPGIYLTKDFITWKREQLRDYGFTHIIIIDKHIQELYYPNQQPEIFKLCARNTATLKGNNNSDFRDATNTGAAGGIHDDSSSLNAFEYYCHPRMTSTATALNFGKDFEVIDLNFGEKAYLTTVLPNCYRAVRFINKALQSDGKILVIDCNGGEQKCLTIIVAYLMYKHNISFR